MRESRWRNFATTSLYVMPRTRTNRARWNVRNAESLERVVKLVVYLANVRALGSEAQGAMGYGESVGGECRPAKVSDS